ncbi:MAG: hypothetical protein IJH40_07880 [Ruminococcus sp.]|uniref:hypothetical protein n=1 Tax=Ruminococcus sp. TaxID=41978 RepID=UPI00287343F1|nr:hypothetical protein [Ruminococcus sp.]MBQ3285543.1 hypothetical protein [Ruminococcus sp.]
MKKKTPIKGKRIVLIAVVILLALSLLTGGFIGVYASLKDTAGTVTESLNLADVTCEVNEDYSVTNTSNIPALIRVRVVVNQTEGDEIVPGDIPSYTDGSDWTRIGDYLYYNGILAEKGSSGNTQTSPAISIEPNGAQIVVLAEAIQAASTASKEEWGVSFSNGSWS